MGCCFFAKLLAQGGGNIVCRNFHWEGPGFPKECFYDSRSKRGRVLMHAKVDNSRFAIQSKRFNVIRLIPDDHRYFQGHGDL